MITALAGGVGGAKLSAGLAMATPADDLSVIVNTADDLDLFGLRVCPDLDTVTYTLAGIQNPDTGWGISGDTHDTLAALERYGQDTWFSLGDQDFATHILRTQYLSQGMSLEEVTEALKNALGIASSIWPMTNNPVATRIETSAGFLDFQDYFVRRRQKDEVRSVVFDGIEFAEPTVSALNAIESANLIVICPSNPVVSIAPILELDGMRDALDESSAPIVAVSPIVAGRAIKGPADRMLSSLGHEPSALGVARMYEGLVDGFVVDTQDKNLAENIEQLGMHVIVTNTIMTTEDESRSRLAGDVVDFGKTLTPSEARIP